MMRAQNRGARWWRFTVTTLGGWKEQCPAARISNRRSSRTNCLAVHGNTIPDSTVFGHVEYAGGGRTRDQEGQ